MNRLRAYRAIEAINQDELGKRVGLTTQMVSAVESGRRQFSGTLEPIGYGDHRMDLPSMSEPLHRVRASTAVGAKKKAHELLRLAGELFLELRDATPGAPKLGVERVANPTDINDINDAAQDVRAMLRHEFHGPISDLTASVEEAGVCVIPIALPGIDGLSAWVSGVPVIGIAPQIPGDRFRLTLGHELGHLLMHSRATDLTESQANWFAGSLLFPPEEYEIALPDTPYLRDFVNLKSSWGVSVAALIYRAHDFGFIDDKRYRALQIQMSKWRKTEPGAFAPRHGKLLSKLVEVNGGVQVVARDLGLNAKHVSWLINWSHLRIA